MCQECDPNCLTCSVSPMNCGTCQDGLYKKEGYCVEECGTGYIIDPETPFKCILDDCDFGYEKDENGVC